MDHVKFMLLREGLARSEPCVLIERWVKEAYSYQELNRCCVNVGQAKKSCSRSQQQTSTDEIVTTLPNIRVLTPLETRRVGMEFGPEAGDMYV